MFHSDRGEMAAAYRERYERRRDAAEVAAMATLHHSQRDTRHRAMATAANSSCHIVPRSCRSLPLLPPITQNVKSVIPANPLEFRPRAGSTPNTKSKSGKNGNVDCRGQQLWARFSRPRKGQTPDDLSSSNQRTAHRHGAA